MSKSSIGSFLGNQLLRSGTSVALNYAEAESAESRKDFIHKIKIVTKELRETSVNLKIIEHAEFNLDQALITDGKQGVQRTNFYNGKKY
jgi:four helix bundle protein